MSLCTGSWDSMVSAFPKLLDVVCANAATVAHLGLRSLYKLTHTPILHAFTTLHTPRDTEAQCLEITFRIPGLTPTMCDMVFVVRNDEVDRNPPELQNK